MAVSRVPVGEPWCEEQRPGLVVDIAQDIRQLNNLALKARRSGMLLFGGGLVKHHICNVRARATRRGPNLGQYSAAL